MSELNKEEILRILSEKEKNSGISYDSETHIDSEKEEEGETPFIYPRVSEEESEKPKSLGKSEFYKKSTAPTPNDLGWKNLPLDLLPSKGEFYPEGTRIAIKPAEVKEVRHFSTIDESDQVEINEKFNYILSRCCSIRFLDDIGAYEDLAHEDRFFIIMAIKDITFPRGENRIILKVDRKNCKSEELSQQCPFQLGIELKSGILTHYKIPDVLKKYFVKETGSFIVNDPESGRNIEFFIPTIGVKEKLDKWKSFMVKAKKDINSDFFEIAPYIFRDWREMDNSIIEAKYREMDYWTIFHFSLMDQVAKELTFATKLRSEIECPVCGEEVTALVHFRKGIRSLFVISDILDRLL
jgi:hypothetical protein